MKKPAAQPDFVTLLRLFPEVDGLEGDAVAVVFPPELAGDSVAVLEGIGQDLLAAGVGTFEKAVGDETGGGIWGFFNCPCAFLALHRIKARLAAIRWLDVARILFAHPGTNVCLEFWPAEGARRGVENLAFLQNLDPQWFARAEKIGLQFLLVTFAAPLGSPIYEHPEVEQALGLELQAEGVGFYDSSFYQAGTQFHVFHVTHLGHALRSLKQGLAARELLPVARILHRENDTAWLCYWSPVESEIAQLVEDQP